MRFGARLSILGATLFCSALVPLSACSNDTSDEEALPTLTRTQSETPEAGECGGKTLDDAISTNIEQVPDAPDGGDWQYLELGTYNPCADLSWIQLWANTEDPDSPSQVMIFQGATFIGTADEVNATSVSVDRINAKSIEVTSTTDEGTSTSTFIWNPETNSVEKHLGVPTVSSTPSPSPTPSTPAPGTELTTKPIGQDTAAIIQTPTGNIGCAMYPHRVVCNVLSPSDSMPTTGSHPYNTLIIESGGALRTYSDAEPAWRPGANGTARTQPYVLDYGDTAQYGSFQCVSQVAGLTCSDTTTGASGFLSRDAIDIQR